MAAVTVDTRHDSVFGDLRAITAQIDIATTGDTWATGLTQVMAVSTSQPGLITAITPTGGSLAFTIGGAVTDALVLVIGN